MLRQSFSSRVKRLLDGIRSSSSSPFLSWPAPLPLATPRMRPAPLCFSSSMGTGIFAVLLFPPPSLPDDRSSLAAPGLGKGRKEVLPSENGPLPQVFFFPAGAWNEPRAALPLFGVIREAPFRYARPIQSSPPPLSSIFSLPFSCRALQFRPFGTEEDLAPSRLFLPLPLFFLPSPRSNDAPMYALLGPLEKGDVFFPTITIWPASFLRKHYSLSWR